MSARPRRLPPLVAAQVRAAPTAAFGAAVAVAVLAASAPVSGAHAVAVAQLAAVALAAGTALLLRDPAASVTAASPTPLWVRRGAVLAVALPAIAVAWLGVLARAGADGAWPVTLTLQLAAVVAVGLAVGARRPALGPAAVVGLLAAAGILSPEVLLPAAGDHARTRIVALALALVGAAAYVRAVRDPVSR